jgi:hypothetical protein
MFTWSQKADMLCCMKHLDPQILHTLLAYDPETGLFTWKARDADQFPVTKRPSEHKAANWNARCAGKPALSNVNSNGYLRGPVLGQLYQAHRVAWAMVNGEWPNGQIDHINGVVTDNRISNLRMVSHAVNGRNAKRKSSNTSGVNGVYWDKRSSRWCAEMVVDRRKISLGYFVRLEDAAEARALAEKQHGFTPSHGRRA